MKVLIVTLLLTASLAQALDYELIINEPGLNGAQSTVIEDRFLELLDQTPSGESVHLNIYGMKMPHIASAITKAKDRGVKFHILMRPFKDELSLDSYQILTAAFPGNDGSTLNICGLLCSATAFNHNKFMLFSKLSSGAENVAVHTSNNFWDDERNNYNDFLIIKNNEALYNNLKGYFVNLRKGRLGNWRRSYTKILDPTIAMYTFTESKTKRIGRARMRKYKRVNHMLNLLNSISCDTNSKVYLAHSRFTDDRLAEARRLKALAEQGCEVKVFMKNDVSTDILKLPLGINIPVVKDSPGINVKSILGEIMTVFPYEEPINGRPWREGDPKKNALHSKIMLIDAKINGKPKRAVVVGTHNFDGPSLKLNNELMLKLTDDNLFNDYMNSFLRLEADYIRTYGE